MLTSIGLSLISTKTQAKSVLETTKAKQQHAPAKSAPSQDRPSCGDTHAGTDQSKSGRSGKETKGDRETPAQAQRNSSLKNRLHQISSLPSRRNVVPRPFFKRPARVPKWWNWQTRHLEGVVRKLVGVRVPPSAPFQKSNIKRHGLSRIELSKYLS